MTRNNQLRLWVDGEKIPDDRVADVFCPPPGVSFPVNRSALITGSRGAGKTTLFRYLKHVHERDSRGIAVHINLTDVFSSLTKQTGTGPLTLEYPANLEPLIAAKASALLALNLAERLLRRRLPLQIDRDIINSCLPDAAQPRRRRLITLEWLATARRAVGKAPLEAFNQISEAHALASLVSSLGELCEGISGPLLLLLDRADMVLVPSLAPAFELLDQPGRYIALVAMRPTYIGNTSLVHAGGAVPGDQYSVIHIGTHPRSDQWGTFVRTSIQNQLTIQTGGTLAAIPEPVIAQIFAFARDSVRTALELFQQCLGDEKPKEQQLVDALDDLRANHLTAAQTSLQRYHPNYRDLLRDLRAMAMRKHSVIAGPVSVRIGTSRDGLFQTSASLSRFVDNALRAGAFCLPEGAYWSPIHEVTEVEVPPLLIWQKADPCWRFDQAEPISLDVSENDLLRPSRGPAKPPTIFVAYRIRVNDSIHFRTQLEEAIRADPECRRLMVAVVDGRVPAGVDWAPTIRKRIGNAKLVVGDVTGMKPEVVFELGLARGLGKTVVPVVSDDSSASALPTWLTATQFARYGSVGGLKAVVASIQAHLFDPEFAPIPLLRRPIPSLAVWLRKLPWNQQAADQFQRMAARYGLKAEVLAADETNIRRAASAAILFASLDNTSADALVHFVSGAVAARPKAGYAKTLTRRVFLLEDPAQQPSSLVADSLGRCLDTVSIINIGQVAAVMKAFGEAHLKWTQGGTRP